MHLDYCDALRDIMGVKFVMNTKVGEDIRVEDIKAESDAVYFGTGAWSQPILGLDGEKLTSFGLNFLEEVNTYLQKTIGEEVLVCGGGSVAMDVALTARRLGAKKVRLICLEQRREMPAAEDEVRMAEEEGVELINGWGLGGVLTDDAGRVTGLKAMRCIAVRDENGRFNPRYDMDDTMEVASDYIILATGQRVDVSFLGYRLGQQLKSVRGLIDADIESGKTRAEGYYAGGDAVTGPNLAIRAIRAGRSAAQSINRDLDVQNLAPVAEEKFTHFDRDGVEETVQHKLAGKPVAERTLAGEDFASLDQANALWRATAATDTAAGVSGPVGAFGATEYIPDSISITVEPEAQAPYAYGDAIHFHADYFTLSGNPRVVWETSADGETWTVLADAEGQDLTVIVSEATDGIQVRAKLLTDDTEE